MISTTTLQPYIDLLPYILMAFFASLLLTPFVGAIALKIKAIDLPATLRKRTDKTLAQRLHTVAKPRLGGLAVITPFLLIIATQMNLDTQLIGVLIGLIILLIVGAIDDKIELASKSQFITHFIVAVIVVVSGTSISSIQVAGLNLDFVSFASDLNIGTFLYTFQFPADIITILWIMTIINAVNWVCGIDALGESITTAAAITTMLLSIKLGRPEFAILPATLAGGILGFIPYNFPPSKIIGGTISHTSFGYLLAVMSMLSGAKITTAIIILGIPIVDMLWVISYRIKTHSHLPLLKRPFVSGSVHLHHRIMSLGYNDKQTLLIETTAMAVVSLVAIYFGRFSSTLLATVGVITGLLIFFIFITIRSKSVAKKKQLQIRTQSKPVFTDDEVPPEQRFAY